MFECDILETILMKSKSSQQNDVDYTEAGKTTEETEKYIFLKSTLLYDISSTSLLLTHTRLLLSTYCPASGLMVAKCGCEEVRREV